MTINLSPGYQRSGLPGGCGLSGEPEHLITIDFNDLNSDVERRLSAGETLTDLMPELHYGVMVELEVLLGELLNRLQTTIEVSMIEESQGGLNSSPQPTTFLPLRACG